MPVLLKFITAGKRIAVFFVVVGGGVFVFLPHWTQDMRTKAWQMVMRIAVFAVPSTFKWEKGL